MSCPSGPTPVGMCGCCNRDGKKNETCHTGDANLMLMDFGFGVCVPQKDLSFFPSYYLCERRQNHEGVGGKDITPPPISQIHLEKSGSVIACILHCNLNV
ncbi:unnamed protein product [Rotaria sp. Silwood1]|nr:unnamed protein product [Rotaria sp. Silwood1]